MNVLLVDDDSTTLQRLEEEVHWKDLGIQKVFLAANCSQAREIITREQLGLLLCDIEMPRENGLELLQWIRKSKIDIVCLLLTAHARFSFAQEAVRLSAFSYLLKPLDLPRIEEEIRRAVAYVQEKKANVPDEEMQADEISVPLVKKIMEYLQDHYTDDLNILQVAEKLNYNPDYLTRVFKRHEKVTPMEYLMIYRLEKSCQLLKDEEVSISEIALLTGFNSSSYFSTVFKSKYGKSPNQYRREKVKKGS